MRTSNDRGKKWSAKIAAVACAYVGTLSLVGGAPEAAAGWRDLPSSACHAQYDNNGTTVNNSGMLTYSGTGTKSIFCPIVGDASYQPAANPDTVVVYGNESTNGANSRACSCYAESFVCACSAATNWNNTLGGAVASGINTYEWGQGMQTEFRYLLHTLTQNSTLVGVQLGN